MPLDVLITGQATQQPISQRIEERISPRLETIYHALGLPDPEVSVVLTDDEEIQSLNAQWRGEDQPTDVLSFPIYEADELPAEPVALGDIIISVPYAERLVEKQDHRKRVAAELGVDPQTLVWTLEEEILFLFLHGLLHLVGYDHADAEEEAEMRAMEKRLWELINHG